jgi:PAS domain S-box-containing protein
VSSKNTKQIISSTEEIPAGRGGGGDGNGTTEAAEIKRLNEELRAQLDEMKTVLEIIPTGVWFGNADCTEITGNAAAYEMLGLPSGINASFTADKIELPEGTRLFVNGVETAPEDMPMQRVARTGEPLRNFEQEILYADGTRKTVYASVAPLFDRNGAVRKVVGAYADFTERKRMEEALQKSENQLRLITDAMPALISYIDADYRYRFVNKAYTEWFGLTRADIIGKTLEEFLGAAAFEALRPRVEEAMTGQTVTFESEIPYKLGGRRFIQASYTPDFDQESGKVRGYFALVLDITDRKRAERALQESNQRYQTLAELSPYAIFVHINRRIVYVNRECVRLFGASAPAEIIGKTNFDFIHPDFHEIARRRIAAMLEKPQIVPPLEEKIIRLDGRVVDVEISASTFVEKGETAIVVALRDISERKRAERQIAGQNRTLEALATGRDLKEMLGLTTRTIESVLTGARASVLLADREQKRLFNGSADSLPAAYNAGIEGIAIGEGVGSCGTAAFRRKPVIVSDIAADPLWQNFRELARAHNLGACWSHPILAPDERLLGTFAVYFSEPRAPSGEELAMLESSARIAGIAIHRKQTEQALRESEERFRLFVTASSDAVYKMSADWSRMLNLAGKNFIADTDDPAATWIEKHIVPEDRPQVLAAIKKAIETKSNFELEHRFIRADGAIGWTFSRAVPMLNADGEIIEWLGAASDVTERRQAEEKIRESEQRFRVMANSSPFIIWVTDAEGRIQFINRAYSSFFGVTLEQVAGDGWQPLIHPDDAPEYVSSFLASLEKRQPWVAQCRVLRHDGRWRWIESHSLPRFSETGEYLGSVGSSPDITERKQAEEALRESEEKFRTLGEAIPNLAWLSDAEGKSLYVNPAWSSFTGLTLAEFNEKGWQSLHPPEELPKLQKIWQTANERGEPLETETLARRRDGVYRWFMARSIPLKDENGKINRWVGTMTDIHELKQAEEALKEANRNKEVFLATLAHELRNPLAPVRSGLEIIRRSLTPPGDSALIEKTLGIIERQTAQIYRLVDDLLDISRITHGKIKLQKTRFPIREAVELAVETSREFIEKSGCRLSVSLPPDEGDDEKNGTPIYLEADLTRVAQVILNLLNNAAKYNRPNGSIRLSVNRDGGEAVVSVADTGFGIPPEMLSNIFEPYRQIEPGAEDGDARGGGGGGLGIGLSVVKKLVEMHGGSVAASSEGRGKGSEFTVRLPLAADRPPPPPEEAKPENDETDETAEGAALSCEMCRILVVDDNEDATQMLKVLLTMENHEVQTALNGTDALRIAESFAPEVVLLDIGLPDLSGFEVAGRLRQKYPSMLIIALSGWGQDEDRRRSREAGCDYHLVKPVEFEELRGLLRQKRKNRA